MYVHTQVEQTMVVRDREAIVIARPPVYFMVI